MNPSYHHAPLVLENDSKITIVGGGPAGAFLAVHLQQQAQMVGKHFDITIVEKEFFIESGKLNPTCRLKGCNCCAGVISPTLYSALCAYHLAPPPNVVCEEFSHVWIQGHWKNFPLKVPPGETLCSVFRGTLPSDRKQILQGLDAFLLERATQKGIKVIPGSVINLEFSDDLRPCLTLTSPSGQASKIESDFVGICCGVNALFEKGGNQSALLKALKKIDPAFRPPKLRQAFIFELKPGIDYIHRHLNKELYLIVSGSKDLHLEHIALVPKKEYISVTLVGRSIDRAIFPEESTAIINAFLRLPHINAILPGITPENVCISCSCSPKTAIRPSRALSAHRMALVGDILGARLYRDGLYSAFFSAKIMAETMVREGIDRPSLQKAAHEITRRIKKDNRYRRCLFSLLQALLKSGLPSRILYQSFATEMKFKKTGSWPLGNVLWKVAAGAVQYDAIVRDMVRLPVLSSVIVGAYKTFRNIFTELIFGLRWGQYGRYPTVIVKDKRRAVKNAIQKPLDITLDESPQMERMYAIKIRASSRAIFEELGKFGERRAEFLRLRFIDVKRTQGRPNEVDSVVTYRSKMLPIAMDLRLIQVLPDKALLYKPQELFMTRGVLLFDISPTKDGNHRLVVYTAFDFKKGKRPAARIFFTLLKIFFPDFSHDVVWNHALCTIKANAEKAAINR